MANTDYKVPCPSCEAEVPITSAKQVGKKVDCPKCKYRFTAPPPPGEEGKTEEKPADGKKKKGKKKAGSTVVVGGALGVLGVVVLGAGIYYVFGGPSPGKPTQKSLALGQGVVQSPVAPDQGTTGTGGPATTPGTGGKPAGPTAAKPKVRPRGFKSADPTNLLPGGTRVVYRVNIEKAADTPFYPALFDPAIDDLFYQSFYFKSDQLTDYVHAMVGPGREPFVLLRTRDVLPEQELLYKPEHLGKAEVVNGRAYYPIKSNPLIRAFAGAFSTESVAAQLGLPVTAGDRAAAETPAGYVLCVYDVETLIVSTPGVMRGFLESLADGYPPYKTELEPQPAPAAPPAAPPPGSPPPTPPPGGPPKPPAPNKVFTSLPTYRTIDPDLKRTLNQLEEDPTFPPLVTYAELIDHRLLAARNPDRLAGGLGIPLSPTALRALRLAGAAVTNYTPEKLTGLAVLEFTGDNEAKTFATTQLLPALNLAAYPLGLVLDSQFTVRNSIPGTVGGGTTPTPAPAPAPVPIPAPMPTPFPTLTPATSMSMTPATAPRMAPPPVPTPGPAPAPAPGDPAAKGPAASTLDVSLADRVVTVTASVGYTEDRYRTLMVPAILRAATQTKGKIAVLTGQINWHSLAAQFPKMAAQEQPDRPAFPRGTADRERRTDRFHMAYPPETRVSFFARLLPHLNQLPLGDRVAESGKKSAWYEGENLTAAEEWVPELLVPYYPPSSWRAKHPLAGGRELGGTNFVGLAGLGLDAARLDPADPAAAKKVGITGYEWGSTAADVKDGLSNTAYLIQAPPVPARPWIAGGGATLAGVDDAAADPLRDFTAPGPNGRGTYVLMADGSVRWLKEGTDPKVFKALVTRAGGESLTDLDTAAPKQKAPRPQDNELRGAPVAGGRQP